MPPVALLLILFVAARTDQGSMMRTDPAVVADEVRAQVTEVALICNCILATTGPFAHPLRSATI